MMRPFLAACLLAASFLPVSAAAQCRLALALALDVSGSVDATEYALQQQALAAALMRPEVQDMFFALPKAPVRLMAYEWSGPSHQRILAPWREISTQNDLLNFTGELTDKLRRPAPPSTALGTAMAFGLAALAQQTDCQATTLDISGDGKANTGPLPQNIKPLALAQNTTVNALVIGADNPASGDIRYFEIGELISYFKANVISGSGAFAEAALGFSDYEEAMTRKLMRELSPGFFSKNQVPTSPKEKGAPSSARPARIALPLIPGSAQP